MYLWMMAKRIFYLLILTGSVIHCQLTFYLPSDQVSEGSCNNPPPTVASNLNAKWISQPRKYYISYGNKAVVRRYAEAFLSRPAKSVDELNTLCLQVQLSGKNMTTFAYGNRTLEQSCPAKKTGILNCFAISGSSGTNVTAIDTSLETVVYTDNKSALLIVRCINDQVRDYKLLSTTPNPDSKIISEVKAKISQLGFSTLYSTKLSCKGDYAS